MTNPQFFSILKLALRELRGGIGHFKIFLLCLVLGVTTIAGVGAVTDAVRISILDQGRALLAGDIELRLFQRSASAQELAYLQASGELATIMRLRGMAHNPVSGQRLLAEIKAIDTAYPFYGTLRLSQNGDYATLFGNVDNVWGAAVDPGLAERLGVAIGDRITIGEGHFQIRAFILNEPDRSNEGLLLGPTIMVASSSIAQTHLIQPGSLYYTHYKLKFPEGTDIGAWQTLLDQKFPSAGWQIRDREGASPGVRRFVDNMGMFLALIGLIALVIGGVGVGNAVAHYMQNKTPTIATFKILGADAQTIFFIYLTQVVLFAVAAIALGLTLGLASTLSVLEVIKTVFPVPVAFHFSAAPLATAALYGLSVTLIFSLWPLAQAKNLPPNRILRVTVAGAAVRPPTRFIVIIAALGLLTTAGALWISPWRELAGFFVGGIALVVVALRLAGFLISQLARRLPHMRLPWLRLAVANLYRPGAATNAAVLSLGLALTLFVLVVQTAINFSDRLGRQAPDQAPAFFMIDVQKSQVDALEDQARAATWFEQIRLLPSLRGQITHIRKIPVDKIRVAPDSAWVLRGDRVLTYLSDIPQGNSIAAGRWWPRDYSGPPLVSFAAEEAAGLGLKVGDTITISILGRPVTAKIANLRTIDWATLDLNFTVIFAPGTLEKAPHTFIGSLRVANGQEEKAHRAITDAFPTITVIRSKEVLTSVNNVLLQIKTAVEATSALALLTGIIVVAGALAAGYRFRLYDSVILKTLGATRQTLVLALLAEYCLLGLITGLLALGFGSLAAWLVIAQGMNIEFVFHPRAAVLTVGLALLITTSCGAAGIWRILGARPLSALREL